MGSVAPPIIKHGSVIVFDNGIFDGSTSEFWHKENKLESKLVAVQYFHDDFSSNANTKQEPLPRFDDGKEVDDDLPD